MADKQKIMQILLDTGAVAFSPEKPYTFSSGIKSPIYCDNRLLMSDPHIRKVIVDAFCDIVPRETKQIAGVATAGIPWACWIADRLNLSLIYVRTKAKNHGTSKLIEGKFVVDETVLVEDLISTAGSSLQALDTLRDEHVFVTNLVAIFSYHFEATAHRLKESEIKAKTILELEDLIAYAKEHSYLQDEDVRKVLQWQKDPDHWKK
ncbi:MAG: orotate phosphoribosyltransferase [Bdellovibrionales bacterium]|nr:orotate phosphoribosyltransferase [Bdellovibrionales bacterium]